MIVEGRVEVIHSVSPWVGALGEFIRSRRGAPRMSDRFSRNERMRSRRNVVASSVPSSRRRRCGWCWGAGRPIAEIVRELQINEGALGSWANAWRRENPEPEPEMIPAERARVKEMEAGIRRLRMEWGSLPQLAVGGEFLKEAVAATPRICPHRVKRSRMRPSPSWPPVCHHTTAEPAGSLAARTTSVTVAGP